MAILVISSDPDELPDLCDRVLVKAEVRIARDFIAANVTRDAIITASYAVPEQAGANSRPMPSPPLSGISPPPQGGPRVLRPKCHYPGLVVMVMALLILSRRAFPTVNDFINLLNQTSLATMIATGLTLAVVLEELDLSIGFAASLHGILVTGLSSRRIR